MLPMKYLILLPILCNGKISIKIKTGSQHDDVKIITNGHDDKLVTDKEIVLFNLTKENLMKGVRVELGRYPNDIFLKDPTPYEDLFKDFEWEEVKRRLQISATKVLQIDSEPVNLLSHGYENSADNSVNTTVNVFTNVENTVLSYWSKHGLPKDEIYFDVEIDFYNERVRYENKWRSDSLKTFRSDFGIQKRGVMKIQPGERVISTLTAQKTIILVNIEYTAKLIGQIITDYEELYGKYHFYAPTVKNIMKAAKLTNEIRTSELIEIRCLTEPKLHVYNKDSGDSMSFLVSREDYRVNENR